MPWTIVTGVTRESPTGAVSATDHPTTTSCRICLAPIHVGDIVWHERQALIQVVMCRTCGERAYGPADVPPAQVANADQAIAAWRARRAANASGHRRGAT